MRCEDRGPDLLAHALGQLSAEAVRELEAHVAACGACRDEAARCAADVEATVRHAGAQTTDAPRALRERILAVIREEAAERRADAAVAAARSCPDVREDLPLLVLGGLDTVGRTQIAAHAVACAACADEIRAMERLVSASRESCRSEAPAALRARVLAALGGAADAHAAPPAPPRMRVLTARRRRRRVWEALHLVPLAAAATLLATILLTDPSVRVHVAEGQATFIEEGASPPPGAGLRPDSGERTMATGDGIEAGDQPVTVRLRLGGRSAAASDASPGRGEVRLRLHPRTRLVRECDETFELESGRVEVHAGPVPSPGARLTIRHGPHWASVVGTRFDAAVVGDRLVVSVAEGQVELGSDGRGEITLGPGEDGLADGTRLLRRASGDVPAWDAFLAPRIALSAPSARLARGRPLLLDASIDPGEAGPVAIPALTDSDPRYVVRLKGPDGRTLDVKVLRSMVVPSPSGETRADRSPVAPDGGGAGERPTVRIEEGLPVTLSLRLDDLVLEPGRWEASLRCQAYGGRDDLAEWRGSVESTPVVFEVTPE